MNKSFTFLIFQFIKVCYYNIKQLVVILKSLVDLGKIFHFLIQLTSQKNRKKYTAEKKNSR